MTPIVYLIRHGQTDWNAEGRLQGQADTDINALGRSQADGNGRRLRELIAEPGAFDFVASPLRRTRETMERVRRSMGLPAEGYRTDARLKEVHFGDWQGSTFAELEAREPGSTAARTANKWTFCPPGDDAESYVDLTERVRPVFEEFSGPVVCVTHGGILRVAFRLFGGLSDTDASALEIPQDRVLAIRHGVPSWL